MAESVAAMGAQPTIPQELTFLVVEKTRFRLHSDQVSGYLMIVLGIGSLTRLETALERL